MIKSLLKVTLQSWRLISLLAKLIQNNTRVPIRLVHLAFLLLLLCGDIHPNPGPTVENDRSLGCIVINAQSLKTVRKNINKIPDFQKIVYSDKPEIVAVSETWLNPDIADDAILSERLYQIHRKDRPNRGGGVLLAISKDLVSKKRPELAPDGEDSNEILPVEVRLSPSRKVLVISAYRPQADCPYKFNENLEITLTNAVRSGLNEIILLGDFNHPDLKWGTAEDKNLPQFSKDFVSLLERFGLIQYNKNPSTKSGNILDLIITNIPNEITSICAGYHPFRSDHFVLSFEINVAYERCPTVTRTVYNFSRMNAARMRRDLRRCNFFARNDTVDDMWNSFKDQLIAVVNRHVPKINIKNKNSPPWVDGDVIKASKKKRTAFKRAKKLDSLAGWSKFKKLRNKVKNLVSNKYTNYINDLAANLSTNPKRFWSFLRSKSRSKSTPNSLIHDGVEYSDSYVKANLFNKFFQSVFTPTNNDPLPAIAEEVDDHLSTVRFDRSEVLKCLKGLNTSKAAGPDGLPTQILKEFAEVLVDPILAIFQKSIDTATVPSNWKKANVIPVFKKGDKQSVCNYRPISLLSVVSKVMERCIYNSIITTIRPKITDHQYGFLSGRSTDTQLLSVFTEIADNLDSKSQTDVVYFDLSKAFDSVSHKLLLHKLKSFGFSGKLLGWFKSYLTDRFQCVAIDGVKSDYLHVTSGVPQGSILGPLAFILFNNDLPSVVTAGCQIAIFADDTKIYRVIRTIHDCLHLQYDINRLSQWGKTWGLKFNITKTNIITIALHARKLIFNYKLGDSPITRTDQVCDLGVEVTNNLDWTAHISKIVSKSNRSLWAIIRTMGYDAPTKAKKMAYLTLVRPILEYCTTLWNPQTKNLIEKLEKIQRRATNFVLNNKHRLTDGYIDYKTRLTELNLLPSSYRREMMDVTMFLKSKISANGFDVSKHFIFIGPKEGRHTRAQRLGLDLINPRYNYVSTANQFVRRTSRIWNGYPNPLKDNLLTSTSPAQIKSLLLKYYNNLRDTYYDAQNTCTWASVCFCSNCR